MAGERLSVRCAYCAYETTIVEEAHENWCADDGAKIFGLCPFSRSASGRGWRSRMFGPKTVRTLNSAMGKMIGEYRRRSLLFWSQLSRPRHILYHAKLPSWSIGSRRSVRAQLSQGDRRLPLRPSRALHVADELRLRRPWICDAAEHPSSSASWASGMIRASATAARFMANCCRSSTRAGSICSTTSARSLSSCNWSAALRASAGTRSASRGVPQPVPV